MPIESKDEKAYVICCNDSIEHVVIGDCHKAEEMCKTLEREYFKNQRVYPLCTWKDYVHIFHWYIQPVSYSQ